MTKREILYALIALLLVTSCKTTKSITYFQDVDQISAKAEVVNYETKIKCDDQLSIVVSGPDVSIVQEYNLNMPLPTYSSSTTVGNVASNVNSQPTEIRYRVDSNGEINFPVLGKISVLGLTRSQLEEYLTTEISKDIKNPVVTVSVTNFNITIIGDIQRPGNYTFNSDKVNIVQAVAQAGDLSQTAKINGIVLIRKVDGLQTYKTLDLSSKQILESEDFYLEQNDILYVKSDITKMPKNSNTLRVWSVVLSSITSILAIASFFL